MILMDKLLILFCGLLSVGQVQASHPWLVEAEQKLISEERESIHFYECRPTRLKTAALRLENVPFLALSDDLASYFVGGGYNAKAGTTAFLVRAVFKNEVGSFSVRFDNGILSISQKTISGKGEYRSCPLVVHLSEKPKKVIVTCSVVTSGFGGAEVDQKLDPK